MKKVYQKRMFLTHLIWTDNTCLCFCLNSKCHYLFLYQLTGNRTITQGIEGILHKIIILTFGIALCGVYLFLNGFLKSPEKLTAEKAQKSSYIQLYKYIALFDIQYIREKDTLPCYR